VNLYQPSAPSNRFFLANGWESTNLKERNQAVRDQLDSNEIHIHLDSNCDRRSILCRWLKAILLCRFDRLYFQTKTRRLLDANVLWFAFDAHHQIKLARRPEI
jgi:hypothetical protein